mgnify:CR=1 FL=1
MRVEQHIGPQRHIHPVAILISGRETIQARLNFPDTFAKLLVIADLCSVANITTLGIDAPSQRADAGVSERIDIVITDRRSVV